MKSILRDYNGHITLMAMLIIITPLDRGKQLLLVGPWHPLGLATCVRCHIKLGR